MNYIDMALVLKEQGYDIFNFSRQPGGDFPQLMKEIKFSNEFI